MLEKNKIYKQPIITYVTPREYPQYLENTAKKLKSDIEAQVIFKKNFSHFGDPSVIFTIKKAESVLRNHVPKENLLAIDKDIEVAVEKCLIFLSNLAPCCYNNGEYKILHSVSLHEQFKNGKRNNYIYTSIIRCLLQGSTRVGPIIEILKNKSGEDLYYSGKGGSKRFRLTPPYAKVGTIKYQIKSQKLIEKRMEYLTSRFMEVSQNPIVRNLLNFYPQIQLPSIEEVREEGRRLLAAKYYTKKGKRLSTGHRETSALKDKGKRAFLGDHIELFRLLTENGLMLPLVTGEEAGGRIVDSFSLMPSWIRKLIKVDGISLDDLDYTALHPNIAISIYGGKTKHITHEKIQEELDMTKEDVKIEHLSFFNKEWRDMSRSPLFYYYGAEESKMMENIYRDKEKHGYKITSQRLLKKEVRIMSRVTDFLNKEEIYVGYVYDALFCHPKHSERVKEVMNYFVIAEGVYTKVK